MIAKISQPPPVTPLMTLGQIAKLISEPYHRINYVLKTRRIRESARAGRLRVFDLSAVDKIRQELAAIDARNGGNTRD